MFQVDNICWWHCCVCCCGCHVAIVFLLYSRKFLVLTVRQSGKCSRYIKYITVFSKRQLRNKTRKIRLCAFQIDGWASYERKCFKKNRFIPFIAVIFFPRFFCCRCYCCCYSVDIFHSKSQHYTVNIQKACGWLHMILVEIIALDCETMQFS